MIEAIYDHAMASLPKEFRKDCPMLTVIADLLMSVKSANNEEVAIELRHLMP